MKYGKLNIVSDGQWGSCGKGLIAGFLGQHYKIDIASTNNLPNAGHTIVLEDGSTFVSKILPVGTFLNTINQDVRAFVGPGSGFHIKQLLKEIDECNIFRHRVRIHPRALVVTEEHAAIERGEKSGKQGTKHIASTMQGSGAAQVERMMRGPNVKLARDFPELSDMIVDDWFDEIHHLLDSNLMWLHEGSQGFSLGILHGSHFPFCTSRECTVSRELGDMGLAPRTVGDVYVVVRPYPIRVGNVVENGKIVGYSGDVYNDQQELTWNEVKIMSGYPSNYDLKEMTTVTKRVRRVFTFSMEQVKRACRVNGATNIALNFANYLDYSCFQTGGELKSFDQLPRKVVDFVTKLEKEINLPVSLIGTGPGVEHVWYRE